MTTTIGRVDSAQLHAEAARWHPVRETGTEHTGPWTDLEPWTHPQVKAAAVTRARSGGGVVVCSGGTTGEPKLTILSPDLGVPRVLRSWRPLGPGDVLLNLFSTGRMWGAHYFYNAVAAASRSTVAPMGAISAEEFPAWADVIRELGVTALAGAPNVLAQFARSAHEAGLDLPIRAVIWSGEPMTRARVEEIRRAFPGAGLWGNYGSIETFVIGVSGPHCSLGALHLLPGQVLEPQEEGALLTRVGDGWPTPAVRFRIGDRVRGLDEPCRCGGSDAFTVVGRADDNIKLGGGMVRISDVLHNAGAIEGVSDAQVVLFHDPDVPHSVEALRLRYTGTNADVTFVRRALVRSIEDLEICDSHSPEVISVERVAALERNARTNKVLPLVMRVMDGADAGAVPA
jgi:phenylacetate-coenzyme A ligase PaaK-like adenylate-forming protein